MLWLLLDLFWGYYRIYVGAITGFSMLVSLSLMHCVGVAWSFSVVTLNLIGLISGHWLAFNV